MQEDDLLIFYFDKGSSVLCMHLMIELFPTLSAAEASEYFFLIYQ